MTNGDHRYPDQAGAKYWADGVQDASVLPAWERRMDAILTQLDRVPELPGASDPLAWDEYGLPL